MTDSGNKRVAFINNALDFATDLERRKESDAKDSSELERLGFSVDVLDLKRYFNKSQQLEAKLDNYDVNSKPLDFGQIDWDINGLIGLDILIPGRFIINFDTMEIYAPGVS